MFSTPRIDSRNVFLTNIFIASIIFSCVIRGFSQNNRARRQNIVHCTETDCEKTGDGIFNGIDPTVNHCDDFYQYACGTWLNSTTLPAGSLKWNVFSILGEKVHENILELVSAPISKSDSIMELKAKGLFKNCMDLDRIERDGITYLEQVIDSRGGLPMIMGDQWDPSMINWDLLHSLYMQQSGQGALLQMNILPDLETKEPRMHFSQPNSLFGRFRALPDRVKQFYRQYLEIVVLEFAKSKSYNVSIDFIRTEINQLIMFRETLSNLLYDTTDERVMHNPYTIKDLQNRTDQKAALTHAPRIDWLHLIKQTFLSGEYFNITSDEIVIVRQPYYVQHLGKLLITTPPRVIVNHLHLHFVEKFLKYTTEKFRNLTDEFSVRTIGEYAVLPNRTMECLIDEVNLPHVLASMYVKRHFPRSRKEDVLGIAENVRRVLQDQINQSPWIDPTSKSRSIAKVRNMKFQIGYPDWYEEEGKLEEFYEGQHVGSQHLFNIVSIRLNAYKLELRSLQLKSQRDTTSEDIQIGYAKDVNAFYYANYNLIVVHAALLQWPIYSDSFPIAIKLAIVGSIISHEMGHAFDETGIAFDENANRVPWWKDRTKNIIYNQKIKCIIEKYSKYILSDTRPYYFQLDGNHTRNENLADIIGISVAYDAFKKTINPVDHRPTVRLPYLDNFSEQQIFFLAYANTYCELLTFQHVQGSKDNHSFGRFRINGPLSVMTEFSDAFNCPPGSPMNPTKKCTIWKL